MTVTDVDYRRIATDVYEVDPVEHPSKQLTIREQINVNGHQFKVIDAISAISMHQ